MAGHESADAAASRAELASPDAAVAIETFVETHYARLLGLARLICRDAADAADAVQVGLEQAWRARARVRDASSVRAWVDRIVVREAVRISRRRASWLGRVLPQRPEVGWIEPPDRAPEPATYVALREAFARLSAEQRAAVALHLHFGYSVAETAAIVGAPVETVRSRLRLARDRLRTELEGTRR